MTCSKWFCNRQWLQNNRSITCTELFIWKKMYGFWIECHMFSVFEPESGCSILLWAGLWWILDFYMKILLNITKWYRCEWTTVACNWAVWCCVSLVWFDLIWFNSFRWSIDCVYVFAIHLFNLLESIVFFAAIIEHASAVFALYSIQIWKYDA